MSHFSVVRDASLALRKKLFDALGPGPDVDFQIDNEVTQIVLDPPTEDVADAAVVSLHLYHIAADAQLRNQPPLPLPLGAGQMLQPPLPLRLYYLITPVSGTEAERQLLLGRVIQAFHDAPMISVLAGQPVGDSHGGGSPELRLVMDMLPPDEIFRLWQALGARQRLSVAYQLRGVVVDSARAPLPAARVGEAHVLVGQAGESG